MTERAEPGPGRRLVLLRHAKSARPEGVPDHERPLAPRGRRDAPAAGRALAEAGCLPDLALCSTALRARQTWELACAQWSDPPPVRYDARLYHADATRLLDVVREAPAQTATLLLLGHDPALVDLALHLAGEGAGDTLDRVRAAFSTSALAILTWHGPTWQVLTGQAARLTAVTVPRGQRT
ncbi:SixA phosphatase family protein [Streptomyces sp. MS06]|uniref:SixA phosphatase family protein n=1 Tax=Streptomyces sp. MS06 TaxID=3385974 RepID=UPI00399FB808